MSGHRSTIVYGIIAATVATFVVSQCAGGPMPSASRAADVTVVDARRQPVSTHPPVLDPAPQATTLQPRTLSTTSTSFVVTTTTVPVVTTTTVPVVTTATVLVDAAAAGPADAGVAAPVRGEQIQLTEPVPAPATTTTTTEPPPPPPSAPQPPQPNPTPPAPPTTQPTAPPPASTSSDAITLTNQERVNAGLAPLNANGALNNAAAAHSADQAARNQMTHTGSNGSNAGDRIRAAGYQPGTWGENVAAGYTSASSVVAGWMGSSGHRDNILNPSFTQIGVASATAANGTRYWTMVLSG
jgi:uncharacterized protein YkwD